MASHLSPGFIFYQKRESVNSLKTSLKIASELWFRPMFHIKIKKLGLKIIHGKIFFKYPQNKVNATQILNFTSCLNKLFSRRNTLLKLGRDLALGRPDFKSWLWYLHRLLCLLEPNFSDQWNESNAFHSIVMNNCEMLVKNAYHSASIQMLSKYCFLSHFPFALRIFLKVKS